jgi:hypothetical protein
VISGEKVEEGEGERTKGGCDGFERLNVVKSSAGGWGQSRS